MIVSSSVTRSSDAVRFRYTRGTGWKINRKAGTALTRKDEHSGMPVIPVPGKLDKRKIPKFTQAVADQLIEVHLQKQTFVRDL